MVDERDVWREARAKFGEMLSGLRRDANVTQDELAVMSTGGLRLSNKALSDLERGIGARPPKQDVVLFYLKHCLPRWEASATLREERRAGVLRELSTLVAMHERIQELDAKPHAPATNQNPTRHVSNSVSGTVTGPVIQARDIHGDVHLSGPPQWQAAEPSDLKVAISSLHSMSGGWFHAFSRENTQVAESFAEDLELPGDQASMDALFDRRLRAGAYVLSHPGLPACAVLSLFNAGSTHEVVVRDVQVTDKTDGPIVDGIAYLIEAGGMNDDPITFHLDSCFPVARLIEDGVDKGRYFVSRHIRVAPGEHMMLPLKFDAEKSSHTFRLTVQYQIRGRQMSTVVDYHGQPFRVSPTARSQAGARYEAAYTLAYDDSGAPRLTALAATDLPPWLG